MQLTTLLPKCITRSRGESFTWAPVAFEGFVTPYVDNLTGQFHIKAGYGAKIATPQILWWSVEAKAELSREFHGVNLDALVKSLFPPSVPNTATIKAPATGSSFPHPFLPNALIHVKFGE